jgi:sugar O-acyltransferase (sialic acid O-acetyltransferase NeuD family)
LIHLIGAGGHGKVVAELLLARRQGVRVLDASPAFAGRALLGLPVELEGDVLGSLGAPVDFFIAVGDAEARRAALERWRAAGHRPVRAVHPAAVVSPSATIGEGACVMAGAVVQTESRIGEGAIINTGATVDHDCDIAPYAHVAPGCRLAGEVRVGEAAWVGIGSSVREGVCIGAGAIVGAGAVVVGDVPPGVVAYGCPCRVVRER